MNERVTIDLWSDAVCPWCVIGWGFLSQALASLEGEMEADIRWRAFELNPDMPAEGEPSERHLLRKYGRARSADGGDHMRAMATQAGVSLSYRGSDDAPAMIWNTAPAHRLLAWVGDAHGHTEQTKLALALFEAHFQDRRSIGRATELAAIAGEAGFDASEAEAALGDDRHAEAVRADRAEALDRNITGVPAMLIDGRLVVPGAQPADGYVAALRRVVSRRQS